MSQLTATPHTARRSSDVGSLRASLAPVRRAMLDDAWAEAERVLAAARDDADGRVDAARDEVRAAVEQARTRAAAARAASAGIALGDARREAHRAVLRARADVWHELVDRVAAAVDELRDDPRYPALLDHLAARARDQLGADATVEEHPDGGIVARSGARRVDYRLPVLARRALTSVASEKVGPWS